MENLFQYAATIRNEQNAEVCDATKLHCNSAAGNKKIHPIQTCSILAFSPLNMLV